MLDATLAELAERGYPALTVEAVAARSGVHKTTIYRRWGSADGLLAAALERETGAGWTPPDTGSLAGDLRELVTELVATFTDPARAALPMAVLSAAFQSPAAARALRAFYADRQGRAADIVRRAVARGEAPAGTDPVEVVRAACAPVFYRLVVTREPVDAAVAERAAAAAVLATRAATFT
ncbi:DNA-binding transcriptional regulator, AcrR family [Amycolatopsis arida]|uniref:DNA-binding transcriptional regulator, AcrR family n=1 Tax=Amycolatopsis arida TaxID=587909 RepID=A0A1I5K601_9PSEU|nr:AcrR family transcriptional regulator [Amycolatopsis arida]SFO80449.1 DNA-binding transcriptional regulator, AcrR family [Amycolatopsis arida]